MRWLHRHISSDAIVAAPMTPNRVRGIIYICLQLSVMLSWLSRELAFSYWRFIAAHQGAGGSREVVCDVYTLETSIFQHQAFVQTF